MLKVKIDDENADACDEIVILREAPPKLSPGSNGHCPNSDLLGPQIIMKWPDMTSPLM